MGVMERIASFWQYANPLTIVIAASLGGLIVWMHISGRRLLLAGLYFLLTLFSGFSIPLVHLGATLMRWTLLLMFTLRSKYTWRNLGAPAQLLVMFSILSLVSTIWSPNPGYGFQTSVLRLLMVFGMGGMLALALTEPGDIRRLFRIFLPAIAVWVAVNLTGFRDFTGGTRFMGSTSLAALFVLNGGIVLLILLWLLLTEKSKLLKYSAALLMVADMVLILMSGQRTGTYGAIIASGVFFIFGGMRSKVKMAAVISTGVLTVVAMLALNPEQSWFLRERYGSLDTSGRGEIFEANMEKALQHPWIGHGAGAEQENYELVLERRRYRHQLVYFHNAFVEAFFQTGIGGLILFAGAVFLFLWKSLRLTMRLPDGELRSCSMLLCSLAVYITVTAFFEQTIISPSMILTLMLVMSSTMLWHLEAWSAEEQFETVKLGSPMTIRWGEFARL